MSEESKSFLVALVIGLILAAIGFAVYYFLDVPEKGTPAKQFYYYLKEKDSEKPVNTVIVNPEFDGTNDEFIVAPVLSTTKLAAKVSETISYNYYGSNGNAIVEIKVVVEDSDGKKIFSNKKRALMNSNDLQIVKQEIEITYSYTESDISALRTIKNYSNRELVSEIEDLRVISRNEIPS